ncbi:MAG: hypothetical protein ACJA01_000825 [Saprospiraceae bacterium]|jgi:hypothetical protein
MSQNCLECGDSFIGRMDKKFCGAQCRSSYNNRLNRDKTAFISGINHILRRNRYILKQLNPKGKSKASKQLLLEKGFRFSYFTNEYRTKAGKVYRFCYDQGYLELSNNMLALVERQEYVE